MNSYSRVTGEESKVQCTQSVEEPEISISQGHVLCLKSE